MSSASWYGSIPILTSFEVLFLLHTSCVMMFYSQEGPQNCVGLQNMYAHLLLRSADIVGFASTIQESWFSTLLSCN